MTLTTGRSKAGFTLSELLLTLVILSFGLVTIVGSYITAASVLNSALNRIQAIEFLKDKLSKLTQEAIEKKGLDSQSLNEQVIINNRPSDYNLEISPLKASENLDLSDKLNLVRLSLSFKERNIEKNVNILGVLEKKE